MPDDGGASKQQQAHPARHTRAREGRGSATRSPNKGGDNITGAALRALLVINVPTALKADSNERERGTPERRHSAHVRCGQ
eukprot:scaffold8292_cov120-Isochrysis_galbana.AAC.11